MNNMISKPKSVSWCAVCPGDYSDMFKGKISTDSKISVFKKLCMNNGESLTFFTNFLNMAFQIDEEGCRALLKKGVAL